MTVPPDDRPTSTVGSAGVGTPEPRLHVWRIEKRELARHEERRGRRHAFVRLDAGRTALVVVDMVPFFVNENPYCRGIVPNVARLASTVRGTGGVVAWVVPGPSPTVALDEELLGPEVASRYAGSGGGGPLRGRVWHELEVRDDDLVVEKTAASAFFPGRSDLDALLAERGVDTVLVTGTVTNVCCESTARDARTLGYRVVMVADANAAVRDRDHNATLHTVYRSFGDVRSTEEVVALLRRGGVSPA